ncbi:hypothetical protein [Fuerstiella marisgermanici]|uniref:YHS domain protein n=1 Tax=Fuerstiella marisgermanici TaxID=1891926 RepID=A0A1P8WKW8_9PLAN|nr:hypothetical protein [Fuerstiella marisgermanici]APZ94699.1 hypothetical protein Fuma_04338 [Fuerstiella marisgermanici]
MLPRIFLPALLICMGCSDSETPQPVAPPPETAASETAASGDGSTVDASPIETAMDDDFDFQPLSTASGAGNDATSADGTAGTRLSGEAHIRAVMKKLKPLQVMLGQWRGITRKVYDGQKAVDNHEWIWDLQSAPDQPSLAVTSDNSPYLRTARLTWLPDKSVFQLTATDADGIQRTFQGDYTDPVHEVVGSDDKLHRVFRLELTEQPDSTKATGGETWKLAFVQQENNRYLLELDKQRGTAPFRRYDTVSTQREGTSFAVSDSDYGDKSCIISQGLGTIAVSHQGRTYWVCCSGCKAAFEEDPKTWIARAAKRAAETK